MVRPEVIRKRLNTLDQYLALLDEASAYRMEDFRANPLQFAGVERYLHLSIEVVNDVAGHVISDMNLCPVDHYRDNRDMLKEK